MGEVDYAPGEPKGTAWHPHRGFETVTYIIDGTFRHQDSNGGGGVITNGDTQWMTAGGGILHIEEPPEALVISGGLFHGFQLWVNLPSALKMTAAALPGHPGRPGRAAQLAGRRLADPRHRGRRRRPRRARRYPHSDRAAARHPRARRPAAAAVAAGLQRAGYVLAGSGHRRRRPAAGADGPACRVRPGRRAHLRRGAPDGRPERLAGHPGPRRPADPRAGRRLRSVRDEHQGRAGPGVRGLPGRAGSARSRRSARPLPAEPHPGHDVL